MNYRQTLAAQLYQALIAADGINGDQHHLESLAKRAFRAADAFLAVAEAGRQDKLTASGYLGG